MLDLENWATYADADQLQRMAYDIDRIIERVETLTRPPEREVIPKKQGPR